MKDANLSPIFSSETGLNDPISTANPLSDKRCLFSWPNAFPDLRNKVLSLPKADGTKQQHFQIRDSRRRACLTIGAARQPNCPSTERQTACHLNSHLAANVGASGGLKEQGLRFFWPPYLLIGAQESALTNISIYQIHVVSNGSISFPLKVIQHQTKEAG